MNEADDVDRASTLSLQQTDDAVNEVRRAAQPEQVKVNGQWLQTDCEDCGEEIAELRLNLGKVRCIYCQQALEHRRAGR